MHEVSIASVGMDRIERALGAEQFASLREAASRAADLLRGRSIWNINSTARGGGVAEMLQPLIAYSRGLGADVRWLVIEGDPDFFTVTKRIHNNIHGHAGDGGDLGETEHEQYEHAIKANLEDVLERIQPRDLVICHDPQTAGLVPALRRKGVPVVWRCHIGHDSPNDLANRAWRFLLRYLEEAQRYVFSRRGFIPPGFDEDRCVIIPPSIDPLSPKNQPLSPEAVRAILVQTGIIAQPAGGGEARFVREDGSAGVVERRADIVRLGPAPSYDRPLVVQVSRWDHLKDPVGVMRGFVDHVSSEDVSLVLAGPNVSAVADDPEGGAVLDEVIEQWRALPHDVRARVHIACLPMNDREENAAIVNALQRHATIVVQKSLYEGFGLTVTEAMWKNRPVVASAVGGIQDQIRHEVHGLLVDPPEDLEGFGAAVERLVKDPAFAEQIATNARQRVEKNYLFVRHLRQYLAVFDGMLNGHSEAQDYAWVEDHRAV